MSKHNDLLNQINEFQRCHILLSTFCPYSARAMVWGKPLFSDVTGLLLLKKAVKGYEKSFYKQERP